MLLFTLLVVACSSNPEAKLHRAAHRGMLQQVESMLKEGADVNKAVDGETPLMAAVYGGQARIVKVLLENGADIHYKNEDGRDIWSVVFENPSNPYPSAGQAESIALLLQEGLEPRLTLTQAVQSVDSKELVEALLARGSEVGERDENGWTPLHHAALAGHESSCQGLLKAGADPNAESTKTIEKAAPDEFGTDKTFLKYEAGTRPADVADTGGSRGQASCATLISEAGGKQNPDVSNVAVARAA